MILAGLSLAQMIINQGLIRPYSLEKQIFQGMSWGLSVAGYDIRIREGVYLCPGGFSLASAIEEFQMPLDVLGIVHDKSSWARKGIAVQNTVFEPGWIGFPTLELSNHGPTAIKIEAGSPIAQVIFHLCTEETEGYKGKYQYQPPRPVEAIHEGS